MCRICEWYWPFAATADERSYIIIRIYTYILIEVYVWSFTLDIYIIHLRLCMYIYYDIVRGHAVYYIYIYIYASMVFNALTYTTRIYTYRLYRPYIIMCVYIGTYRKGFRTPPRVIILQEQSLITRRVHGSSTSAFA